MTVLTIAMESGMHLRSVQFFASVLLIAAPAAVATASVQPQATADVSLDRAAIGQLIRGITTELRESYVLQDEGAMAAESLEKELAANGFAEIKTRDVFAERLTSRLRELTGDSHVRVISGSPFAPSAPSASNAPDVVASRLDGRIGYIRLARFPQPDAFVPVVDRAMGDLQDTSAMIIDLRDNGGGHPASVAYLASFFFRSEVPVHLNDLVWRNHGTSTFRTDSFWTSTTPVAYIDKPVYVLVSARTYSAAEEFAYDMQVLKRATIVGERTRGGANPGGLTELGFDVSVVIPTGKAPNPITQGNWGGRGVEPDIRVTADLAQGTAMALAQGHIPGRR